MRPDENNVPEGHPSQWSGPHPWTKAPTDVNFELGYKSDAHRFADYAVNVATECFQPKHDPRDRSDRIRLAQMWATLSLQFKLDELNETLKHVGEKSIETNAELTQAVKTAANYLHRDARDLKAHLRVIEGRGEAA